MAIETDTITLPEYWASALINGDYSGLEPDEKRRCKQAVADLAKDGWRIVSTMDDAEPRFTRSYGLYDPLGTASAGSVLDYCALKAT